MGKKLKTKSKILSKWAKKHGIKQVNLKLSKYDDVDARGIPSLPSIDEWNRAVDKEIEAQLAVYDFGVPGQAKTETISPKFSVHKMRPGKKGKAIPVKETFMKTKVEVGPEVRASDFEQVFLPKDRDGALALLREQLYARLNAQEWWRDLADSLATKVAAEEEVTFLRNLLDLIERS